ncbi:GTP-binding protein [Methanolobus sp. WCC5]|uniref:GTP-binding protein n=1 Tax=Methanolobus sp. WCC5 TaxID=3125785 RepID=UPI003251C1F7
MQIIIAGGFTGTEKENAVISIGNILNSMGKKVAVLITEYLEKEKEDSLVADPGVIVRKMISGCVPCSFLFDLMAELQEINEQDTFDHIIIELPFNSMPAEIREGLGNMKNMDMSFSPIIHIFDVRNLESNIDLIPRVVSNQIRESEIVFMDADAADPEKLEALRKIIGTMSPEAGIFEHLKGSKGHELNDFVNMVIRKGI